MDLPKIPEIQEFYLIHNKDLGYLSGIRGGDGYFSNSLVDVSLFPNQLSARSRLNHAITFSYKIREPLKQSKIRKVIVCLDD